MIHALGYIPDHFDVRDDKYALSRRDGFGQTPAPSRVDLRADVPAICDQDGYPSCVAQAIAAAVQLRQILLGTPGAPLGSRYWIWYYARKQHDAHKDPGSGTQIRYGFKAITELGLPPEAKWPQILTDGQARRKPSVDATMAAYPLRGLSYHRLTGSNGERQHEVQQALMRAMPVVFGTIVAESFLEDHGSLYTVPPPTDTFLGGHAMVVVGYDSRGCYVLNSWGQDWRDNGFAHLTWEYILWHRTQDLWAVDLGE